MKRICWILTLVILVPAAAVEAQRLVDIEVTVREKQVADSQYVVIAKSQFGVHEGIKTTAFLVNFTLDVTAAPDDSGYVVCRFSLFTLGPQAQTFFKEFTCKPGGVYFLDNVHGKENVVYRVGISPVSVRAAADEAEVCHYDYRADSVWNFDPSANFDFYFVPRSLADARWNMLRDYVEISFKDFKELLQLNYPGKINYFFAPCLLPEVIWDQRMGYAIDPPRSNCFALYSRSANMVDPYPALLTRLYRNLGYAPPLLAEGMAAYFDFPHYYGQKMRKAAQLPPLTQLIKSIDYFGLPGVTNVSAAASFVKYLVDTQGGNRFLELYRAATDLTLADQFNRIYGMSLAAAEKKWHALLDTVTFPYGQYRYFYERERYIGREDGMAQFMGEMKKRITTYEDSVFVYSEEAWNLYMRGDYQPALDEYRALLKLAPNNAAYLLVYGNLFLLDGRYDSAIAVYHRAFEIDTTTKTPLLKIGESYWWQRQTDSATTYLIRDLNEDNSQLSRSSSAIMLGDMALEQKDTAGAITYYEQALGLMQQVAEMGKARPAFLMRMGQAHLGLAMCRASAPATARAYLESALYFEVHPTRPIFITRILGDLGMIADLEGRRDEAIGLYQRALSYPVQPAYEVRLRQYIAFPFAGFK